ncbi:MAG TPA: hypothetical protein PLV75_04350, partial [Saprospiraceae bacterium]|nr:hypothetical protein [Saprospiraceae bacterium]
LSFDLVLISGVKVVRREQSGISKRSGDPAKCTAFVAGEQRARGKGHGARGLSGYRFYFIATGNIQ